MTENVPTEGIQTLREALEDFKQSAIRKDVVLARKTMFARFQPIFAPGDHPLHIECGPERGLLLYEVEFHLKKPEIAFGKKDNR